MFFGIDPWVVASVVGAAAIRTFFDVKSTVQQLIAIFLISIFCGFVFGRPLTHWLGYDPNIFTIPFSVACAIFGVNFIRQVIYFSGHPFKAVELYNRWRNK